MHEGEIADRELLVARGDAARLLEPPHAPLDALAPPVVRAVEADRSELARFGVLVSEDCGGSGSENHIFVPAKVVGAYAAAMAAQAAGQPAPTLSCADIPGTQDYVRRTRTSARWMCSSPT